MRLCRVGKLDHDFPARFFLTRFLFGTIYRGKGSAELQDVDPAHGFCSREGRRSMAAKKKAKPKAKKKK
jgi:hypothetical protein